MSEYYLGFTGAQLDDAINKVRSGYIKPEGSMPITENGTFDVREKAEVKVNVPTSALKISQVENMLILR